MSAPSPTPAHLHSGDYFHVCFAVPDLEAAMQEITDLTGVGFHEPLHDRIGDWPYSLVFTAGGPPIELISSVAGSPWETDVARFHHLAWWSSCLTETVDAWTRSGASVDFDGRDHERAFAYFDAPRSGLRLEAVDISLQRAVLDRWAPGDDTHLRAGAGKD